MSEAYELSIVVDPAVGMGLNIDTKNSRVIGESPGYLNNRAYDNEVILIQIPC